MQKDARDIIVLLNTKGCKTDKVKKVTSRAYLVYKCLWVEKTDIGFEGGK